MKGNYLRIDINVDLPQETLQYIFDCWIDFIICDLGYSPADLPIYEACQG